MSRRGALKYTPAGDPVYDFTLAVPQRFFDKDSTAYIEILVAGRMAEEKASQVKIGEAISLRGSLVSRSFRNRQGLRVNETKVFVDSTGGIDEKE